MSSFRKAQAVALAPVLLLVLLAGCNRNPLIVKRSPCPAVAVPVFAGDITRFTPGAAPDVANLDIEATITNVRSSCNDGSETLVSQVSYDVVARRAESGAARQVQLPVFATVVQGGNLIVSKQVGSISVDFAAGATRAVASGTAQSRVSRAVATLPLETQRRINRKRRPGDPDAAVDPMAEPAVQAALRAASFEMLVGFQLSDAELAYNVTK